MKVLIVAGSVLDDYDIQYIAHNFKIYDYIIAADRGYDHLIKVGAKPNVIIGDLDSVKETLHTQIIKYNSEKDKTDLELSILHALEKGATSIEILCGLSGEFDHEIANIFLLAKYPNLITYKSSKGNVTSIDKQSICLLLNGQVKTIVSIIPFGKVNKLTIKGLKYSIQEDVDFGTKTLRNEYLYNQTGEISLENGIAIIYIASGVFLINKK